MEVITTLLKVDRIASSVGLDTDKVINEVEGGNWVSKFARAISEKLPLDPATAANALIYQTRLITLLEERGVSINLELLTQPDLTPTAV